MVYSYVQILITRQSGKEKIALKISDLFLGTILFHSCLIAVLEGFKILKHLIKSHVFTI